MKLFILADVAQEHNSADVALGRFGRAADVDARSGAATDPDALSAATAMQRLMHDKGAACEGGGGAIGAGEPDLAPALHRPRPQAPQDTGVRAACTRHIRLTCSTLFMPCSQDMMHRSLPTACLQQTSMLGVSTMQAGQRGALLRAAAGSRWEALAAQAAGPAGSAAAAQEDGGTSGLCLWAVSISLTHPRTGHLVRFGIPEPPGVRGRQGEGVRGVEGAVSLRRLLLIPEDLASKPEEIAGFAALFPAASSYVYTDRCQQVYVLDVHVYIL